MDLPEQKWFTVEELAARWEISKALVERYIQTGQLICSSRYFNPTTHEEIWRRDTRQIPCTERADLARAIGYEYDGEYVKLEDVLRVEEEHFAKQPGAQKKKTSDREERSDLHIIGALLQIIMDNNLFGSEEKLRGHIAKEYQGYSGCTERTLAGRFSEAKKRLID